MERVFRALADRNRLRMVLILERGPLSVGEIASVLGLSQSNSSHHLRQLTEAGIVRRRGQKGWAFYSIDTGDATVSQLVRVIAANRGAVTSSSADMRRLSTLYRQRRNRSREFFSAMGEQWDKVRESLPPPSVYIDTLTGLVGSPDTLLEVGVGTGHLLPLLLGLSRRVVAVDNSPEMLRAASGTAESQGLASRVEFRLGEAEHLPLGDNSVDVVLMHFMLHHAGNPRGAVQEAARVMRGRGRLVLVELTGHTPDSFRHRHGDLWPGFTAGELTGWAVESGLLPAFENVLEEHSTLILSFTKGDDDGV